MCETCAAFLLKLQGLPPRCRLVPQTGPRFWLQSRPQRHLHQWRCRLSYAPSSYHQRRRERGMVSSVVVSSPIVTGLAQQMHADWCRPKLTRVGPHAPQIDWPHVVGVVHCTAHISVMSAKHSLSISRSLRSSHGTETKTHD